MHTILNRVSIRSHPSQTLNADKKMQGPSSPPAKVKVNVTIHEDSPDETELETTSGALFPCLLKVEADIISPLVDAETTMRLSALRWSVAGVLELEDKKRAARTAGTFFKLSGSRWSEITAAHSTLADIADGESEVTLKLVFVA